MEIKVVFENIILRSSSQDHAGPAFGLYVVFPSGIAYPDEYWIDSGALVVSWWLVNLKSMVVGTQTVELPFMEGPYALTVTRRDEDTYISAREMEETTTVPLNVLISKIINISNEIEVRLQELKVSPRYVKMLLEGREELTRVLHQRS